MDRRLKLYPLGGMRVQIGEAQITDLGRRKAGALLVYLCIRGRPVSREILGEMFWKERGPRRARTNPREVITEPY